MGGVATARVRECFVLGAGGVDGRATTRPGSGVVTRGAQPIGDALRSPWWQAPVWGLGRSLALEFPEFWGGSWPISDPHGADGEIAALVAEILQPEDDQVGIRRGERFVARLVPRAPSSAEIKPLVLRPEGTYLITGGLGELGLRTARWLVERGARRLVLVGRRRLPAREQWASLNEDHPARGVVESIAELERLGATVVLAAADVADSDQMEALFEQLKATLPPIRGVIHAAGLLTPQTARDLDLSGLLAVLRPKVAGAWILDRLTRSVPLDFFVSFSSFGPGCWGPRSAPTRRRTSSSMRSPTTGKRRACPALTVNWGSVGRLRHVAGTSPEQTRRAFRGCWG